MTRWDESISVTVAPARWYPNRSTSGLMVWSAVATEAQDGLVFHAAVPAFSVKAAPASGRCETARTLASSGSTSAAKIAGNFATSTVTSVPVSAEPSTGNSR